MVTFLYENLNSTDFLSLKRTTYFILLCSYIVSVPIAILCPPASQLILCVHFFPTSLPSQYMIKNDSFIIPMNESVNLNTDFQDTK